MISAHIEVNKKIRAGLGLIVDFGGGVQATNTHGYIINMRQIWLKSGANIKDGNAN